MSTQSTTNDAELIILGGGCAGLSLAARLAAETPALKVLVVEPRTVYKEDRTWCGWRLRPHLFEDCAIARWNKWRVVTPSAVIERSSKLYPYEMIRSDLFYDKASAAIMRAPAASILHGVSADTLVETMSQVEVHLSDGTSLRAPWVLDTRPPQLEVKPPWLWQNFVGFVVEFEPTTSGPFSQVPTLMDFQPRGDCVAQFMYILPISEREFLCEWTQFASLPGQMEQIEASLVGWLAIHAERGWKIQRRESGSLPMALPAPPATGRIIAAGTRGGSMRASTGYAFHSIQRWAETCASSIRNIGAPASPSHNPLLEMMDALFLKVLQQPSTSAAEIFRALFEGCPPDALVRFLAGLPRGSDLWPVMRGLPWAKFLLAAPTAAYAWGRR